MPFEELSHTGDLQYRVTGATPEEIFCDAVRALTSTLTDLESVRGKEERMLGANGDTREELLVNFLRACLDLFNKEEFLVKGCSVTLGHDGDLGWSLRASLTGEKYDPARHPYGTEIKAVTYHGAVLREKGKGWEGVFTLDL